MTLKEKREVVARFKAGESMVELCYSREGRLTLRLEEENEAAIRDYMNKRFTVPKRKKVSHG